MTGPGQNKPMTLKEAGTVPTLRVETATPVAPPTSGPVIKVRAKEMCYYNLKRQRPGDVFTLLAPKDFSPRYMERVSEDTPERTTPSPVALRETQDQLRVSPMQRAAITTDNPLGAE